MLLHDCVYTLFTVSHTHLGCSIISDCGYCHLSVSHQLREKIILSKDTVHHRLENRKHVCSLLNWMKGNEGLSKGDTHQTAGELFGGKVWLQKQPGSHRASK